MSTELAPLEAKEVAEFALFSNQDVSLHELFEENLADDEFKPGDLNRISVPSGGATTFEIPTADGPVEVKELEAIIIKATPVRFYWKEDFGTSGAGTPPDCYSEDLIHGHGDPGGLCADCPMNQFQNGGKEGKPCTEKRNIFILPADSLLPYNLSCPVQSIKNFKKYRIDLTRRGLSITSITTLISLQKEKNNNGINYSQLIFRPGRTLSQEQAKVVRAYRDSFSKVLEQAGNDQPNSYNPAAATEAPDFDFNSM